MGHSREVKQRSGFKIKAKMTFCILVSLHSFLRYQFNRSKLIKWVSRYDIWWAAFHWVGPFIVLNLMSDLANFKSHYICGSVSLVFIIAAGVVLLITKMHMISPSFILQMDPIHPYIYTYGCFSKMIVHSVLVLFGDSTNFHILFSVVLGTNVMVFIFQSFE